MSNAPEGSKTTGMPGVIMCCSPAYEYKGWKFEMHNYCGPTPLRKDGEPRERIPQAFWGAFQEWFDLPDDEKATFLIQEGGCFKFQ